MYVFLKHLVFYEQYRFEVRTYEVRLICLMFLYFLFFDDVFVTKYDLLVRSTAHFYVCEVWEFSYCFIRFFQATSTDSMMGCRCVVLTCVGVMESLATQTVSIHCFL